MEIQATAWLEFTCPEWLFLLPLAAVPWLVWLASKKRDWKVSTAVVAVRVLAILLAVVAAGGPVIRRTVEGDRKWMVLRDVSLSTGSRPDTSLEFPVEIDEVRFAGHLLQKGESPSHDNPATRLAPPLELAAGRLQRRAGALLLTDGRFDDEWRSAAMRFAGQLGDNFPFVIVPLDSPDRDVRIDRFFATGKSDRFELTLVLEANAMLKPTVVVERLRPGEKQLYRREVKIFSDRPATLYISDTLPPDEGGLWRASLKGETGIAGNDTAVTGAGGEKRVLCWTGSPVPDGLSRRTGMKVKHVAPNRCPAEINGWMEYAAVVVVDRHGKLLTGASRDSLAGYIESGGGLVLIGSGPRHEPADRRDPLNRVAALIPNPFERNPLSLSVVLDASGSMASWLPGRENLRKFDLASEAILSLAGHLASSDRLKVTVFSNDAEVIYSSGDNGPDFPRLGERLRGVRPSGPTNVAAAMKLAVNTVPSKDTTGLVIVLSDLQTKQFDPEDMAKTFRDRRWRISLVVSGDSGREDYPLLQLAGLLKGQVEYGGDLAGLDRIFARFCREARGDGVERGNFTITARPGWEMVREMGGTDLAVIQAAAAENANVLAEASGRPILATGTAGLGRTCCCMVLPPGGGSSGMMPPLSAISRMIESVAAPGIDQRFTGRLTLKEGFWRLEITAMQDGLSVNGLQLRARVLFVDRDTGMLELEMKQSGPGKYETEFHASGGTPAISVNEASGRIVWRRDPMGIPSRELSELGANYDVLGELVAITGGRIMTMEEIARDGLPEPVYGQEGIFVLWPWLMAAAIFLVLLQWLRRE